jgi:trans-L-3-hydroxyproline dehydratase
VRYDLAYGGAFYAYVDARALGFACTPAQHRRAIDAGMAIKRAFAAQAIDVRHPFEPDLGFLYGTIFVEPSATPGVHSRNLCVFAAGEVDRSATGSGVSGRAAILHRRGELRAGETLTIESLIGSTMTVAIVAETTFGPHAAVIPRVGGTSHYTGEHHFVIDPADPLGHGFLLR